MQGDVKVSVEGLPLVLRMSHVQAVLGCSKNTAYELAHQKGFPVVRLGKAIRVPRDAFLRWLESQASGSVAV
jgi:excisionase family DNA binding protein